MHQKLQITTEQIKSGVKHQKSINQSEQINGQ
jgi:hypothetical protein